MVLVMMVAGGLLGQVRKATALAKSRNPKLLIEGPVQVRLRLCAK